MSLSVVVLGMHRSGTSCLARILHAAGVDLGQNLMTDSEPGNLLGHWECTEMVQINDRILEQSGGSWDRIPSELRVDEQSEAAIQQLVNRFRISPVHGWKDPRTTVTFSAWKPRLEDYRIMGCVRNPLAVARSLEVREGWSLERGLDLWCEYNERLLQHIAEESKVFWFPFDAPTERMEIHLRTFCEAIGLTYRADLLELFNSYLRHHQVEETIEHSRARGLYEELCTRIAQCETQCKLIVVKSLSVPAAVPGDSSRLQNLTEVVHRMNALQQQQFAQVRDLTHAEETRLAVQQQYAAQIAELQRQIRLQDESTLESTARIAGLQQHTCEQAARHEEQLQKVLELERQLIQRDVVNSSQAAAIAGLQERTLQYETAVQEQSAKYADLEQRFLQCDAFMRDQSARIAELESRRLSLLEQLDTALSRLVTLESDLDGQRSRQDEFRYEQDARFRNVEAILAQHQTDALEQRQMQSACTERLDVLQSRTAELDGHSVRLFSIEDQLNLYVWQTQMLLESNREFVKTVHTLADAARVVPKLSQEVLRLSHATAQTDERLAHLTHAASEPIAFVGRIRQSRMFVLRRKLISAAKRCRSALRRLLGPHDGPTDQSATQHPQPQNYRRVA